MSWRHLTAALILVAPALILAYDIAAGIIGGQEATITAAVRTLARQWSELPWIVGGLLVFLWLHLFGAIIVERLK